RDRGVAVGCLSRRRGREARRPPEDQLVPALSSEHPPHQGESGGALRRVDRRGAGSAGGRIRRSAAAGRGRLRVRGQWREHLHRATGDREDHAAADRARRHHPGRGAAAPRRCRHRRPRGALHPRRGLSGGGSVLHRDRGRDHAHPGARRPSHRHGTTWTRDQPAPGALLLDHSGHRTALRCMAHPDLTRIACAPEGGQIATPPMGGGTMRLLLWLACVAAVPVAVIGCGGGGTTEQTQTTAATVAPQQATPPTAAPTAKGEGGEEDEEYELDVIAEAEPDEGAPPLKVQFTASVEEEEGGPWSYAWDFGDGAKSTEQNPLHTYDKVGEYTATLAVNEQKGNKGTGEIDIFV